MSNPSFARAARSFAPALALGAAALLLSSCGSRKDAEAHEGADDPALTGALGDQIMVDPDLAAQNRGDAAIGGGGPASGELPSHARTPEAIAAARAEAVRIAGGRLEPAPAAETGLAADVASAATAAEMALAVPAASGSNCARKVGYTATWATRLPAAFPVYPRAAVQEAAGTDRDGCSLRVVNFLTPVDVKDVVDFYHTRALGAGYSVEHRIEKADHVLGGTRGAAAYLVYVRPRADRLTDVDLVVNGG